MATSVKPIPEGMRTLTPHLICAGATAAIDFYKRAFNATEQFRLAMPDGRLAHACLAIGCWSMKCPNTARWGRRR